jgi:hypothetical protein
VLVAFIRLQFVCCCGSFDHAHFESQPEVAQSVAEQSAAAQSSVAQNCECKHHNSPPKVSNQANSTQANSTQADSKAACGCQLCEHDDSHAPHLATEHLRILPTPNVNFASLVEQRSMPLAVTFGSDDGCDWRYQLHEKCLHSGISILCQFGHLRI